MILMSFLWFGAMLTIWLSLFAVIRFGVPDSLIGKVATVIT